MDEQESQSTPELDAARQAHTDIMTNKDNPRHEGFKRGDRDVMEHIDGLYKGAVGDGKVELGGDIISKPSGPGEDINGEGLPALTADQVKTIDALKGEWGSLYQAKLDSASSVVAGVPPEVMFLPEVEALGDHPAVLRGLAVLGEAGYVLTKK